MSEAMESEDGFVLNHKSYHLYQLNSMAGQVREQLTPPCLENMAKGIIAVDLKQQHSFFESNLKGVQDCVKDYQWVLDNKLVPDRHVSVQAEQFTDFPAWNEISVSEREKALRSFNIPVLDLTKVNEHFIIGRELAKPGAIADISQTGTVRLNRTYGRVDLHLTQTTGSAPASLRTGPTADELVTFTQSSQFNRLTSFFVKYWQKIMFRSAGGGTQISIHY